MAYENLHVATSPLTGKIYIGRLNKAKDGWAGDKRDVTDIAKIAVVDHLRSHRGGSEVFTLDGGKTYFEISVKSVEAPKDEEPVES